MTLSHNRWMNFDVCLHLPRSVRGSWPPLCVRSTHRDTPEEDGRRPRRHCWSVCPPRPLHGVPSRRWSTRSPAFPHHTHRCRPVVVVGEPPPHLQRLLKDDQSRDANIIPKINGRGVTTMTLGCIQKLSGRLSLFRKENRIHLNFTFMV